MFQKFSSCFNFWWRCWFPFSVDVFACGCSWTTPTSSTVLSCCVECQNDTTKKLNVRSPTRRWVTCTTPCTFEKEDKQRVIKSYERELETLNSYVPMMKDTSETDKQDAERFRADLKKVKLELEENELSLLESKEQCDFDLEREIHELQDSLDQAQAGNNNINEWYHHELEFHSEVYTIRQATRFHPFNECELLMRARPIVTHRCSSCVDRRIGENFELDQYQQGYRWWSTGS